MASEERVVQLIAVTFRFGLAQHRVILPYAGDPVVRWRSVGRDGGSPLVVRFARSLAMAAGTEGEIRVSCTIDGQAFEFTTWTDMSALLAIRLNARYGRPRRGCEAGTCGACESTLDGAVVRLCQTRPEALCGAVVVTGNN